ncbi:16S rRNA (guanine(527)-N(7))-methyltransferase RsmG [Paenibacillus pinisoli]|uniref:Ribosomal RNA small subunit methyltransferase G n=1 Tax=Paenibacillus pinisoli TaxID=1276110 RepID=A0A3A6PAG3_9BACL|nr:16S rRNA (guanine(527)-N(7))-methyltransferase RsmG [Paenibacillus pinisoli]RJX36616.1 16S rRNA (guanine(527)-N(7))-methyltransferase RsmG [Paenibacillus pinisoli]
MDKTTEWFTRLLKERGISLSELQLQQFEQYYTMLVDWNERMNLTGITERDAVYEKHFYDSISLAFYTDMNKAQRLADIGSGAGFPSIPLKICFPHLNVLIVDSLNKRIGFLKALSEELGLRDVHPLHGRAEDVARLGEHRDQYDLVTARAVARLNVLNEFCLPFVIKGGLFAAMKGAQPDDEVKEASFSLKELRGKLVSQHAFTLPHEQSERHIVLVQKTDNTPKKYPRKAGTPLKQPLV